MRRVLEFALENEEAPPPARPARSAPSRRGKAPKKRRRCASADSGGEYTPSADGASSGSEASEGSDAAADSDSDWSPSADGASSGSEATEDSECSSGSDSEGSAETHSESSANREDSEQEEPSSQPRKRTKAKTSRAPVDARAARLARRNAARSSCSVQAEPSARAQRVAKKKTPCDTILCSMCGSTIKKAAGAQKTPHRRKQRSRCSLH